LKRGLFSGDSALYFTLDVERLFQIKLTDTDCATCTTMGDVEKVVLLRLREQAPAQDRCMSALAFYRLRQALAGKARKITPSTPVQDLGASPRQIASALKREAGLPMSFPLSGLGQSALLLLAMGTVALLIALALRSWPTAVGAIALFTSGLMAMRLQQGGFGGMQLAGDVAREFASQNFGYFVSHGARFTDEEVWRHLQGLAVSEVGGRMEDVTRGTLIQDPGQD
jgi:hypothetical protein